MRRAARLKIAGMAAMDGALVGSIVGIVPTVVLNAYPTTWLGITAAFGVLGAVIGWFYCEPLARIRRRRGLWS